MAWLGVGIIVARPWVAGRTGSTRIFCGQNRVWSNVHEKNPTGFKSDPGVLDGLPPKGRQLGHFSPAVRFQGGDPARSLTR
jgi:hypothetical protein